MEAVRLEGVGEEQLGWRGCGGWEGWLVDWRTAGGWRLNSMGGWEGRSRW